MLKRLRDWFTRPSWDDYLAEHQAAVDALTREDDLKDELERLRGLLADQVDASPLMNVDVANGGIEVAIRPPLWALKALAGSFLECLDGAPNWRAYEIGPIPSDGGMLIATVQRADGETPVETCRKLREMIEELADELTNHTEGSIDLFERVRILLNPEKKDS